MEEFRYVAVAFTDTDQYIPERLIPPVFFAKQSRGLEYRAPAGWRDHAR
jgi:hypothetical protein